MDTSAALFVANKIINELLESSSSSEDDDELVAVLMGRPLEPRVKNFVENVINAYTEDEFKKNLRVSRNTAIYLVKRYLKSPFRRCYQGGKQQLSAETQILAFLWFSGNISNYREVSNLFNMSLSTTCNCLSKVLKFMTTEIAQEVIKFPQTNDGKEAIANEFEDITDFPNVLGCVARCSISIRSIKSSSATTTAQNQQAFDGASIYLQAVCDSRFRFLDVNTADPNNIPPESSIANPSLIGKDLANICSPQYHLLGNEMYPLREYLLKPYPDKETLSDSERNYNSKFTETHGSIIKAFSILKSRFRQLTKTLEFRNIETMSEFIISCCVLHNICIDREDFHNDISSDFSLIHSEPQGDGDSGDLSLIQLGHFKRNETKEHLHNLTKY